VAGPYSTAVGTATALSWNAYNSSFSLLALSPGSVFFRVQNQVNGTNGLATVDSSGNVLGQTAGTVAVTATVDGVSSQPFQVAITPQVVPLGTMTQATSGMVFDPRTGHLWVSVPPTDPKYGNSVIEIDPATESVLTSIPVGTRPSVLALSDDGTALYVGLDGSDQFARVDPVGGKVVATYSIGQNGSGPQHAISMSVQPGNPNVVAISQQDDADSTFTGGCIYVNGILLPKAMGTYDGGFIAFSSPTTLWGSDLGLNIFQGSVDDTSGATLVSQNDAYGGVFRVAGGNLYFANGEVISGTTGRLLGSSPSGLTTGSGVAVDPSTNTVYLIGDQEPGGQSPLDISVFNSSTFLPEAIYGVGSGPQTALDFTEIGSGGLAFRDGGSIYFVQLPTRASTAVDLTRGR
jgi:DNA-binding beta-propeller fold protein YncE